MATPKQVAEGLALFAEKELLPALDGWKAALGTAVLFLACSKAEGVLAGLMEHKAVAALVCKDGEIDTEAAIAALKQTARKQGKITVPVPILDITFAFTEKDVETLRGCMEQAAGA